MASEAQHKARETAGSAADEGKHVAGVASEEARKVAGEATQQAHGLVDEARAQLDEQSHTQRDRLVGVLRTVSDDLEQMASRSESSGVAADLVRQSADRARRLGQHLEDHEPAQLLDEVRDFARRSPGTFLLGALAAGVVAGRLTRGLKDSQSGGSGATQRVQERHTRGHAEPHGTATGTPLAGVDTPTGQVAYPDDTPPGSLDQPVPGVPATGERRPGSPL